MKTNFVNEIKNYFDTHPDQYNKYLNDTSSDSYNIIYLMSVKDWSTYTSIHASDDIPEADDFIEKKYSPNNQLIDNKSVLSFEKSLNQIIYVVKDLN